MRPFCYKKTQKCYQVTHILFNGIHHFKLNVGKLEEYQNNSVQKCRWSFLFLQKSVLNNIKKYHNHLKNVKYKLIEGLNGNY